MQLWGGAQTAFPKQRHRPSGTWKPQDLNQPDQSEEKPKSTSQVQSGKVGNTQLLSPCGRTGQRGNVHQSAGSGCRHSSDRAEGLGLELHPQQHRHAGKRPFVTFVPVSLFRGIRQQLLFTGRARRSGCLLGCGQLLWPKPSLAKPTFLAKLTRISVSMFWAIFCVWPM